MDYKIIFTSPANFETDIKAWHTSDNYHVCWFAANKTDSDGNVTEYTVLLMKQVP